MIDCVSVANMRRSDAYTIEHFVSGMELIRRAAYSVFRSAEWMGSVAIVAGSGNNGADGFALACILKEHQIDSAVYTVSERLHTDCAAYADMAAELGVEILPYRAGCLAGYDTIVDCMLGTGFGGGLRENYRRAIEEINHTDAYVISVDINSGMNGDSGVAEAAVRSDLTVAIGYVKRGMVAQWAAAYMKRLICVDIGIVLLETEDMICGVEEWVYGDTIKAEVNGRTYYRCPAYLDINVKQYSY